MNDLFPPERERAQPTGPRPGSWIIRERETGRAVYEVFDAELVETIRQKLNDRYEVVTILRHLQDLNTQIEESAHGAC